MRINKKCFLRKIAWINFSSVLSHMNNIILQLRTYILQITLHSMSGICVSVCVCVQVRDWVCAFLCVCTFSPNRLPSISCTLSIYCLLLYITLTGGTWAEAPGGRGLLDCLIWWTGIVWNPQTEVTSCWPHLAMTSLTPQLITRDLCWLIPQYINISGSNILAVFIFRLAGSNFSC